VLFKQATLDAIARGEVTLAFRRWVKPTVRAGGRLRTGVGELAIEAVDATEPGSITAREAARAGFASREALMKELASRSAGDYYRIRFRLAGPDTRIALREDADLSPADAVGIAKRLAALDTRAAGGAWTSKILTLIKRHPNLPARDLARLSGFEKEWLKTNIRKLKNLGLTESLNPGYRLSPRGEAYVAR